MLSAHTQKSNLTLGTFSDMCPERIWHKSLKLKCWPKIVFVCWCFYFLAHFRRKPKNLNRLSKRKSPPGKEKEKNSASSFKRGIRSALVVISLSWTRSLYLSHTHIHAHTHTYKHAHTHTFLLQRPTRTRVLILDREKRLIPIIWYQQLPILQPTPFSLSLSLSLSLSPSLALYQVRVCSSKEAILILIPILKKNQRPGKQSFILSWMCSLRQTDRSNQRFYLIEKPTWAIFEFGDSTKLERIRVLALLWEDKIPQ